jgi:site-specific DNA recombinase
VSTPKRQSAPPAPVRTAIYCRISKDSEGAGLGVARQQETARALALARGWDVDPNWVLIENDTSASSKKPRPQFERLMAAMASGEVRAVISYRIDRLIRRLDDMARLIDIAQTHNVLVATVSGELDMSTAQSRGFATIMGVLASIEVDATSERLRDRNTSARGQGRLTNGGSRPYGWDVKRVKHNKAEAAVIREVAGRLIDGEALTSVCRDLNRRSSWTAGGKRWDVSKLRDVLSNHRHAGRLEHAGEVVTGADGRPVTATWPAILDPDVFDALQAALAARRVVSDAWTGERRHLLSGSLSRCAVCDEKLLAFSATTGVWAYRCRGHLARNRDQTDACVLAQVRERALAHPIEVTSWTREEQVDLSDRIDILQRRLADLEESFISNGGDAARLARMTSTLETELAGLQTERLDAVALHTGTRFAQLDMSTLLASSGSLLPQGSKGHPDPKADELKASVIAEQRGALRLFVERVVIAPSSKRGRYFDHDSIEIVWRDPNRLKWTGAITVS